MLGLHALSAADVAAEAVHDADGRIVRQAVEVRLELVARHDARRVVGELAVDVHDLAGGLALERERHLHVALVTLQLFKVVHGGSTLSVVTMLMAEVNSSDAFWIVSLSSPVESGNSNQPGSIGARSYVGSAPS